MNTVVTSRLKNYFELCKPKVVGLIVFTTVVGMFLATPDMVPPLTLLYGTLGIGLAAAQRSIQKCKWLFMLCGATGIAGSNGQLRSLDLRSFYR